MKYFKTKNVKNKIQNAFRNFVHKKSERNIIVKKRNEINEVEKFLEDIKYFQIRRKFFSSTAQ